MRLLSGIGRTATSLIAFGTASAQSYGVHPRFAVFRFYAGATPHSAIGFIELSWSHALGVNASACSAQPGTYQSFPSVERTECSDPTMSFDLTRTEDGGANLKLWYEPTLEEALYAVHKIKPEQIVWRNQQSPTGTVQVYAGPQNFTVRATYSAIQNI